MASNLTIGYSINPFIHRSIETPVKRLRLELEGEGSQKQGVLSPTANLPNLVRDGLNRSSRTPTSARKKGAAPSDWLTNLSREDQMTSGMNSININHIDLWLQRAKLMLNKFSDSKSFVMCLAILK